jgi:hypothetical protein
LNEWKGLTNETQQPLPSPRPMSPPNSKGLQRPASRLATASQI